MASFRKKGKTWYYRFINHKGTQVERKGHWDLVTTKALARQDEDRAAKIRAGLHSPETSTEQPKAVPMVRDHLESYAKHLAQKGKDPKHIAQTKNYASRIIDLSGIKLPVDLT